MPLIRFPIIATVPILLANGVVKISLGTAVRIVEVSGFLRSLTAGPFTVQARRLSDSSVIGALTFNAAGIEIVSGLNELLEDEETIVYDVTALGVGALDCLVTTWAVIPQSVE